MKKTAITAAVLLLTTASFATAQSQQGSQSRTFGNNTGNKAQNTQQETPQRTQPGFRMVDSAFASRVRKDVAYQYVAPGHLYVEGYLATTRDLFRACEQMDGRLQFGGGGLKCLMR